MIDTNTSERSNRHPDCYVPAYSLPQRLSPPDLRAEAAAICELSKALAADPGAAVRYLLNIAQALCGAGSTGLSRVHVNQTGEATIRWEAVSGVLSSHETTDLPRDDSPCGFCLDIGIPIVIPSPQRVFDQLTDKSPTISELLTIPLYDGGRKPLGTLWVAHHDSQAHFDGNDVRIAEQLAGHLALALKLQEQASQHANALAAVESNQQEVHHRTKNTLQIASNLLAMQARASSSAQVRDALTDSADRLHILAKVHELLYASASSTQRVFMPQLLLSLGSALGQSFGRTHPHVALDIACDPMDLPAQHAIALALLANEAITNAYKHAFANESPGKITVALQRTRENALSLRIEDTGIGFTAPDGGEGMGLKLIRAFATQLAGTLAVRRRDTGTGTLVTLTIAATGQ